jgi:anti-sigma regulatory factor (Ser/Thr protein kinase)
MSSPTLAAHPHDGYRHEAYVFHHLEQFLDDTLSFVRDGVRAGQPVMVAVTAARLESLRAALGPDAEQVQFVDMAELGANPARIIPAWRAFIDERGLDGQPVRGVGEPIWNGRREAELIECQLHEALLNVAVSPATPLWLRCPYDAGALPEAVIEEAQRSHPMIVEGDAYRGSTLYGGSTHVDDIIGRELPEPEGPVETLRFAAASLPDVREAVARRAVTAPLDEDRIADLVLVMHELAANSVRHGGGEGMLRIWQDTGSLVTEIHDPGRFEDVLAGRRMTSASREDGRGLWLAHQLSDLVQMRRTAGGTAIRVSSWLS